MNRTPNPGITLFLYVFGIALIIAAILILLKGSGVITTIPNYVILALVLIALGLGILLGLKNLRRY